MKTRLIFVRHAEAEGNINRTFHGWTDSEITEKGHLQAKIVAERLKDIPVDILYSSSLKRTLQTAAYISEVKNLTVIRTDNLKEINGGQWEGMNWCDLPNFWPEEYDIWENSPHNHKMPEGESMEEFFNRLIKEIMYIINVNKGKNICIITHGTALRVLMSHFYNKPFDNMINIKWIDNTGITIIDYEDGKFEIIIEGDASHLNNKMSTIRNQEWYYELNGGEYVKS